MKEFILKHKWPLIIALSAILVRLVYLYELSLHPGFTVPMIDEKWHWEWAHEIINKSFWGENAYFRAPLYPYLLAFLSWITDSSIFWTKFLQTMLSGGTAVFIYLLGHRLFNRATGIVSGFIYALYGTMLFYETMFLIPILFLFFVTWGMYRIVVSRDSLSKRTWLVTGLIFGLAAISRPNILLVVPFLMLWMYLTTRKTLPFRKRIVLPSVMLAGVMIAILPVTTRNLIVTGDFNLISSQGGINLYLGNNQYADGLTMMMPEVDLDESVSWREFGIVTAAAAKKEAGRELSETEISTFWTGKAIDFIVSNPGKFANLVWRKSVYLLCGFENSDNTDIYYQREKSGLLSALLIDKFLYLPFGLLLPLALVGVFIHRKMTHQLAPLYIFLAAYTPSIVLFLVTARHRLPLIPFIIVIAAGGMVKLVQERKKIPAGKLGICAAIFLVSMILFNQTWYEERAGSIFQIHFNNGLSWDRQNNYSKAEMEYYLADSSYPYSATLINNLAHVQFKQGKNAEALKNYYRAIALKPDFASPYNNLGLIMFKQHEYDSALTLFSMALDRFDSSSTRLDEIAQIHLNMADAFEANGQLDSASASYYFAMLSGWGNTFTQAAAFYARIGFHQYTDSLFKIGRHLQDLSAVDQFNWGLSFLERKLYTEGVLKMRHALKIDPSLYQAWYCIAVTYYDVKEPRDSVNYYLKRCLDLNPEYRSAVNLKKLLDKGPD